LAILHLRGGLDVERFLFEKGGCRIGLFGMLMLGGCSTFNDYTVNGVPVESLYAESDQQMTDANVDNGDGSFCGEHRKFCALLFLVAGGIAYAIQYNSGDPTPSAPVATPTPTPGPGPICPACG